MWQWKCKIVCVCARARRKQDMHPRWSMGRLRIPVWRAVWLHGPIFIWLWRLRFQDVLARVQVTRITSLPTGRKTAEQHHVCAAGNVPVPKTWWYQSHGEWFGQYYFSLLLVSVLFSSAISVSISFLPISVCTCVYTRETSVIRPT